MWWIEPRVVDAAIEAAFDDDYRINDVLVAWELAQAWMSTAEVDRHTRELLDRLKKNLDGL